MRRFCFVLFLLLFVVSALYAEKSIYSVMSGYSPEVAEALLSGETIQYSSTDGDIVSSIAFDGTEGKEKAVDAESSSGSFTVGVSAFVPYPDGWENMSHDEKKKEILNTLLKVSSIKGITYISHSAGDKPKVLFSEAYTLTSATKGKKAYDVEFSAAPEEYEYEIAAYLKDNIFGGNTYIIDYDINKDEIFVTFTNKDKLKVFFVTILDSNELDMCVDVLMTEEGLALFAMTVVGRDPVFKTPFGSIELPPSFLKRIIPLKDWFVSEINR